MLTAEQQAVRLKGIGGSEVAAICGLSPYKSALAVYMDKVGLTAESADTQASEWGTRLEAIIAAKYAEAHGVEIVRPGVTYQHPTEPWMLATPDGMVVCGTVPEHGLEVKTAGLRQAFRWGEADTSESGVMPEEYLVSCAWYCAVLDLPRWDLAVLIGGQDYREYTYRRDMELEASLVRIARKFWFENVLKRVPPAPDASESTANALKRIYPDSNADMLQANEDAQAWGFKLKDASARLKAAEHDAQEAENHLKAIIMEHAGVEGAFGRVTWKRSKDSSRVDWEGIARELNPPVAIVTKHTETKPGSRRFLAKWADEQKEN